MKDRSINIQNMKGLDVEIAGVNLPNPVMPAAGAFEYGEQKQKLFSPSKLGAIVNKTIFRDPRKGNPPPRVWETPSGMLNSIGIPTKGLEWFLKEELPVLAGFGPPVIASIAGGTVEEFCEIAEALSEDGRISMIELDLSCPNLNHKTEWSGDPEALKTVVRSVKKTTDLPVSAKLTPLVTDILSLALAARDAGSDAIVLGNTLKGTAIDIKTRKPALGNIFGGLSGPAIKPIALGAVYTVFPHLDIPVIGVGGIASWQDALEYIMAGASAVGVGMYSFVNPLGIREIISGLGEWLEESEFSNISEVTGIAHLQ